MRGPDKDNDFEVSFLKKLSTVNAFVYPENEDLASIYFDDVLYFGKPVTSCKYNTPF